MKNYSALKLLVLKDYNLKKYFQYHGRPYDMDLVLFSILFKPKLIQYMNPEMFTPIAYSAEDALTTLRFPKGGKDKSNRTIIEVYQQIPVFPSCIDFLDPLESLTSLSNFLNKKFIKYAEKPMTRVDLPTLKKIFSIEWDDPVLSGIYYSLVFMEGKNLVISEARKTALTTGSDDPNTLNLFSDSQQQTKTSQFSSTLKTPKYRIRGLSQLEVSDPAVRIALYHCAGSNLGFMVHYLFSEAKKNSRTLECLFDEAIRYGLLAHGHTTFSIRQTSSLLNIPLPFLRNDTTLEEVLPYIGQITNHYTGDRKNPSTSSLLNPFIFPFSQYFDPDILGIYWTYNTKVAIHCLEYTISRSREDETFNIILYYFLQTNKEYLLYQLSLLYYYRKEGPDSATRELLLKVLNSIRENRLTKKDGPLVSLEEAFYYLYVKCKNPKFKFLYFQEKENTLYRRYFMLLKAGNYLFTHKYNAPTKKYQIKLNSNCVQLFEPLEYYYTYGSLSAGPVPFTEGCLGHNIPFSRTVEEGLEDNLPQVLNLLANPVYSENFHSIYLVSLISKVLQKNYTTPEKVSFFYKNRYTFLPLFLPGDGSTSILISFAAPLKVDPWDIICKKFQPTSSEKIGFLKRFVLPSPRRIREYDSVLKGTSLLTNEGSGRAWARKDSSAYVHSKEITHRASKEEGRALVSLLSGAYMPYTSEDLVSDYLSEDAQLSSHELQALMHSYKYASLDLLPALKLARNSFSSIRIHAPSPFNQLGGPGFYNGNRYTYISMPGALDLFDPTYPINKEEDTSLFNEIFEKTANYSSTYYGFMKRIEYYRQYFEPYSRLEHPYHGKWVDNIIGLLKEELDLYFASLLMLD